MCDVAAFVEHLNSEYGFECMGLACNADNQYVDLDMVEGLEFETRGHVYRYDCYGVAIATDMGANEARYGYAYNHAMSYEKPVDSVECDASGLMMFMADEYQYNCFTNCDNDVVNYEESISFEAADHVYYYTCMGVDRAEESDISQYGFQYDHEQSYEVDPDTSEEIMDGINRITTNAAGTWGGSCTCPDGKVYWVGDMSDGGQTLACFGGLAGESHYFENELWSGMMVHCGTPEDVESDRYYADSSIGEWWDWCTCPSGDRYRVGDITGTGCSQFACNGGVTDGECHSEYNAMGSHMAVDCGTAGEEDMNVVEYGQDIGTWGGECVCPDGKSYFVGDIEGMGCEEFACYGGGVPGDVCYHFADAQWSHKKVTCSDI